MLTHSNNSKLNRALTAEWSCPPELFGKLDSEFHFTLDACAQRFNAKCQKYFTPAENGLRQDWKGEMVWCFPPSGTKELRVWVDKAQQEARKKGTTVVMLLPVSTDSMWFQTHINQKPGVIVRFLPKRVSFTNSALPTWEPAAEKERSATRPSMVVIFTGKKNKFRVEYA